LTEPLGYPNYLNLLSEARLVLTESGGIREETMIVSVPCLTLRENTERPVTVEVGSNPDVDRHPDRIVAGYRRIMGGGNLAVRVSPLWDGRAAERMVDILARQ